MVQHSELCDQQPSTNPNKGNMMNRLQRFRVSLLIVKNSFIPSQSNRNVNGSYHILQGFRFYGAEIAVSVENNGNVGRSEKISRSNWENVRKEAEAALIEYFHLTRSLNIMDAEHMSKNAPEFFNNLLTKVDIDSTRVGSSVTRFLRYNPVYEFEPFFESIGLKPAEYTPFLPKYLMFLADDQLLLENYHALCNYGVERNKIGKIYKEATEVFRCDYGVLQSRLQCIENLGLRKSLVAKIVASDPRLLTEGVVSCQLVEFLQKLKKVGIENYWLEQNISEGDSWSWKHMNQLLSLLSEMGLSKKQVRELLTKHPDLCSSPLDLVPSV